MDLARQSGSLLLAHRLQAGGQRAQLALGQRQRLVGFGRARLALGQPGRAFDHPLLELMIEAGQSVLGLVPPGDVHAEHYAVGLRPL